MFPDVWDIFALRGFGLRVSGRHTVESQTGDMVDSFRDMIFALGEGFGR